MPNINDYVKIKSGTKNINGQVINDIYTTTPWKVSGTSIDDNGNMYYTLLQDNPDNSGKSMKVSLYGDELTRNTTVVNNSIKNGDTVTKNNDNSNKPTSYTILNYDEKTRTAMLGNNGKVTSGNISTDDLNLITKSYVKEYMTIWDEDLDTSETPVSATSTDTSDEGNKSDTLGVIDNTSDINKKFTSDVKLLNSQLIKDNDKEYVLATTSEGEAKIPLEDFDKYVSDTNDAMVFEEQLITLLKGTVGEDQLYYYSSRLFGIPHQFTPYCDYRTLSTNESGKPSYELAGRKFVENIMLDAPVLTVIPGKPLYLPGNKKKQSSTIALLQASNGSLSLLAASDKLKSNKKLIEKLRYYDFQPDYFNYMKYVNVMCATAAVFLDLGEETIDGVKFTQYDWKNYRWLADKYSTTLGRMGSTFASTIYKKIMGESTVDKIKDYGGPILEGLSNQELAGVGGLQSVDEPDTDGATETDADNSVANQEAEAANTAINSESKTSDDNDLLSTMESLMTSMNYVQFYIDAGSGVNESASNASAESQLSGVFSNVSDLAKELNFAIASGGADNSKLQNAIDSGIDALAGAITDATSGTFSSVLTRIMSNAGNIMKGETMIFPKIYQSSDYQKSYSVNINLTCVYGNKLSYFLNVLVPLFHILGLVLPKQGSANTYSTPFLIRAYLPGIFSCNLGLCSSVSINKNPDGDAWTMDGYPSKIQVSISIEDLYSDLSMTPAGDIINFFANSSLVEYIATSCGINLTVPQLKKRIGLVTAAFDQAMTNVKTSVTQGIWQPVERYIQGFAGV